jgi:MFS family permease
MKHKDGGLRCVPLAARFTRHYWTFLVAENFYDFGIYIFVLLYNLYLLDLGYREDFLGWVASAMSIGSIAGALPAAGIVQQFGLKRTVIGASMGVAILCALRTATLGGVWLIATAFIAGIISSVWAVSLVPVVAALTTERNRAWGYSLWTGWGIGLGVICGVIAGSLPVWIQKTGFAQGSRASRQKALLLGSAMALFSPLLLARLPLQRDPEPQSKTFARNPFVRRYLLAFAVWNLGVGAFNPFFTAYFSRQLHMTSSQIGLVFSASQFVQVGGLLAAPLVLKRLGPVTGISFMQAGTAVSLLLLAMGPAAFAAGIVYAIYGAFQYMSEPATFTLLMSRVEPSERAGASALSFFVASAAQAAASGFAGVSIVRVGYRQLLVTAAITTGLAAWLFKHLLDRELTRIDSTDH